VYEERVLEVAQELLAWYHDLPPFQVKVYADGATTITPKDEKHHPPHRIGIEGCDHMHYRVQVGTVVLLDAADPTPCEALIVSDLTNPVDVVVSRFCREGGVRFLPTLRVVLDRRRTDASWAQ
jgi:hypothetical protein